MPERRLRDAEGNELGEPSLGGWMYRGDEFLNSVPEPSDWGPWEVDPETLVLRCDWYEVDLEWCRDSAQVLDWIMQVVRVHGADDNCAAGFIRAVGDILHPQEKMCSGGILGGSGTPLTSAQIRQQARDAAAQRAASIRIYGPATASPSS